MAEREQQDQEVIGRPAPIYETPGLKVFPRPRTIYAYSALVASFLDVQEVSRASQYRGLIGWLIERYQGNYPQVPDDNKWLDLMARLHAALSKMVADLAGPRHCFRRADVEELAVITKEAEMLNADLAPITASLLFTEAWRMDQSEESRRDFFKRQEAGEDVRRHPYAMSRAYQETYRYDDSEDSDEDAFTRAELLARYESPDELIIPHTLSFGRSGGLAFDRGATLDVINAFAIVANHWEELLRVCPVDRTPFLAAGPDAVYCSDRCSSLARGRRFRENKRAALLSDGQEVPRRGRPRNEVSKK